MRGLARVTAAVALGAAMAAAPCAASMAPPPFTPVPVREKDPLDRFLMQRTDRKGVDYGGIRAHDRAVLDRLIAELAATDTSGWAPLRRMALHIDLYNLVMIRAVVDRWKPGWTPAADGFAVFRAPLVPTRRGPISLDELEKQRTLAAFRDSRAHVAFNCAAVSCPRLEGRGWSSHPDAIDARLEQGIAAFIRGAGCEVDHERRVLRLSRIFDWYAADFGGRAGVLRTVARALGRDVSGYRVEFLEYDWSLNAWTYPDGTLPRRGASGPETAPPRP